MKVADEEIEHLKQINPNWNPRRRRNGHNGHAVPPSAPPGSNPAYVKAAVDGELADLESAPPGTRNATLNDTTLRGGRLLLPFGPAAREDFRSNLVDACHANGLIRDDGLKSVEDTIDSAFLKADSDGPAVVPKPTVPEPKVEIVAALPQSGSWTPPADEVNTTKSLDRPRVFRATELQPARQPRWLARQRLPRAAVSLLIGPEGIGKSLLWVWLVAFITTGKPSPEFGIPARDPARVLLVVTEDDWSTEVLPRLLVAGADIDMVDVICTEVDGSGSPLFPRDMQLVYETGHDAALIVIDAWLDTVPAQIHVRDTQQAREALHPWKEAATSTGAAVLLVTHTNRISSGNTRDTYGATVGLRQKARMALYGTQDDDGNLVIGPDKANGVATVNASVFAISSTPFFPPAEDHDGTVGQLGYVRDSDRPIKAHVLGAFEAERGDDPQERVNAEVWLREYLTKEGPRAKSAEAKRDAIKAGISDKMLRRAREKLRVVYGYEGFPADSVWSLPEQISDLATEAGAI